MKIGQCIVQASRPRSVIAPVPFVIGVELDKTCESKWVIDHLSRFGVCITADEVLHFKESAIENTESTHTKITEGFTQRVADNVDHNVVTLTN